MPELKVRSADSKPKVSTKGAKSEVTVALSTGSGLERLMLATYKSGRVRMVRLLSSEV